MEPLNEFAQILARELPFKRFSDDLKVTLESLEAVSQHFQGVEVVGREHFSLNNREVDLDLMEPTGMDRAMDHSKVGVATQSDRDLLLDYSKKSAHAQRL